MADSGLPRHVAARLDQTKHANEPTRGHRLCPVIQLRLLVARSSAATANRIAQRTPERDRVPSRPSIDPKRPASLGRIRRKREKALGVDDREQPGPACPPAKVPSTRGAGKLASDHRPDRAFELGEVDLRRSAHPGRPSVRAVHCRFLVHFMIS